MLILNTVVVSIVVFIKLNTVFDSLPLQLVMSQVSAIFGTPQEMRAGNINHCVVKHL